MLIEIAPIVALVAALAAVVALAVGHAWGARSADRRAARRVWGLRNDAAQLASEIERLTNALAATQSAVTEALLYVDRDQRVVDANPAALHRFQLESSLAAKPSLTTVLRSADPRELVAASLETGAVSPAAAELEPATVAIGDARYKVQVAPLADGGAVMALVDVTAMEQLARARRDLVANFSHDLRTPLTSLSLLIEALMAHLAPNAKRRRLEPAEARTYLAQMYAQVEVLTAMAEGLVMLNQIESGRAPFRLQSEPLHELVATAVESLSPQMAEADVRVRVDIPGDQLVLADRAHLLRVLTNLLDNALHHSPAGTELTVFSSPADEPDRVQVSVADDGPGILPSELARIFERFYRGDRARSGAGAGLGLAIARHIVEGHGGVIWAVNNDGPGATFHFTLPADDG